MAAPTVTFPSGSMNRLTALVVTDGSDAAYTFTQAALVAALHALKVPDTGSVPVRLDAIVPPAPIVTALTTAIPSATQALLRAATIAGPLKMSTRIRSGSAPAAVANAAPIAVDVDTDAATPTFLEVNVALPTTACSFYLDMIAAYSMSDGPNCVP